jgi:hypothetical protein
VKLTVPEGGKPPLPEVLTVAVKVAPCVLPAEVTATVVGPEVMVNGTGAEELALKLASLE